MDRVVIGHGQIHAEQPLQGESQSGRAVRQLGKSAGVYVEPPGERGEGRGRKGRGMGRGEREGIGLRRSKELCIASVAGPDCLPLTNDSHSATVSN